MQLRDALSGRPRDSLFRHPGRLFLVATLITTVARLARGASDPEAPDRPSTDSATTDSGEVKPQAGASSKGPEDTSTKRVALEVAAYNDSDHVSVLTPSVALGVENESGASVNATYLVDIVSAASADIVSTASSRWTEVRQAGSLSGSYKPHDFGITIGGSVSREPDYLSYGPYAMLSKDFDQKNWTVFLGAGFGHDTIGRCGDNGICTPFSVFSRELERESINGGFNFVIDRNSLGSIAGDLVIENGDQSKPYRYVPMFSPDIASTVAKGASIDWVNQHRLPQRPLEQLPLSRERLAITGKYAHEFGGSTLRLEERLYNDSWRLNASSTDVRWIFDIGKRVAFWPHVHFHTQGSVYFWQRAYTATDTPLSVPEYRTGDRQLGPLWTTMGGLGLRIYLGGEATPQQWSVQLTGDAMYTSFLDDIFLTFRTAVLGALSFGGEF